MASVLAAYYQAQAEEEQQSDIDPAEDVAVQLDDFVNSKERIDSYHPGPPLSQRF